MQVFELKVSRTSPLGQNPKKYGISLIEDGCQGNAECRANILPFDDPNGMSKAEKHAVRREYMRFSIELAEREEQECERPNWIGNDVVCKRKCVLVNKLLYSMKSSVGITERLEVPVAEICDIERFKITSGVDVRLLDAMDRVLPTTCCELKRKIQTAYRGGNELTDYKFTEVMSTLIKAGYIELEKR